MRSAAAAIVRKDLLLQWRTRAQAIAVFVFGAAANRIACERSMPAATCILADEIRTAAHGRLAFATREPTAR